MAHTLFYLGAFAEGLWRGTQPTPWTMVGLLLYAISVVAFVLVWRALNRLWTVKLLIASDHVLNQSTLFRWVRHPNYFLNIIPELCGLALIMGAWIVLVIGLPCYLLVLRVRIRQEEQVLHQHFPSTRRVRCHPVTRTPRLVIPPNGGVRSPGNPGMRVGLPCGVAVPRLPPQV